MLGGTYTVPLAPGLLLEQPWAIQLRPCMVLEDQLCLTGAAQPTRHEWPRMHSEAQVVIPAWLCSYSELVQVLL